MASLSAIGAFIPIFFLMIIHYRVRKSSYKERTKVNQKMIELIKSLIKIDNDTAKNVYDNLKVKDYPDFVEKIKQEGVSQNTDLLKFVGESVFRAFDNQEKITAITLESYCMENYSFKTYISNILDKRFPDDRLPKYKSNKSDTTRQEVK